MTYHELIQHKSRNSLIAKRIFIINLSILLVVFLFTAFPSLIRSHNNWVLILIPAILLIPSIVIMFTLPQQIKKKKQHYETITNDLGDKTIEQHFPVFLPNCNKINPILKSLLLLIYCVLIYLIVFVLYNLLITTTFHAGLVAMLTGTSLIYMMRLIFSFLNYELIFTETHLIYNYRKAYEYTKINKYQYIKLVNQGYILDINTGDIFIRVHFAENSLTSIRKFFN